MFALDKTVQVYFSLVRVSGLTEYMYILSTFFDVTLQSLLVTLCVAFLIYLFRGFRYAFLFLSTLFTGAIFAYLLKVAFNVTRPADGVLTVFGQSFPSYHALIATIFFGMLMFVFDSYFSRPVRIIFNIFCVAAILLVSLSRLYLGVHWLSDVVAGIVFGVAISYSAIVYFRKWNR